MSGISRPGMVRLIVRFLVRSFIGLCVDVTASLFGAYICLLCLRDMDFWFMKGWWMSSPCVCLDSKIHY